MKKNCIEAIVIGADHHNTMGVVRALGANGIVPHLIVHSGEERSCIRCFKSRYAKGKKIRVLPQENSMLEALNCFAKSKTADSRIPIIPTDDYVEYILDKNYNQLKCFFILPTIAEDQGSIIALMDKYDQFKALTSMSIPVAKTELIDLNQTVKESALGYPLVLKPHISAFGSKSDIIIVHNTEQYYEGINSFQKKNYNAILAQEYISKQAELCTFGCITPNSNAICYGTLKKLRYYPYSGGSSLSFAQFSATPQETLRVIEWLRAIGYSGLFDIESFQYDDRFLLNEINFRNSGNMWALVKEGINAPLIWLKDALGLSFVKDMELNSDSFFMNETADFHHVVDKRIKFRTWLRDVFRTKSFNKFWIKDIRGSLIWLVKH